MNKGSIVEAVLQHLIALGRVAKNRYINYLLYFAVVVINIIILIIIIIVMCYHYTMQPP